MFLRAFHLILQLLTCSFLYGQTFALKGKIVDNQSGEGIEYATVTLHHAKDSSILDGVVSLEGGHFEFKEVVPETLYYSVQFMGYEPFTSQVFTMDKVTDVGLIRLGATSMMLNEIEVTGRSLTDLHKLDKQVFDAGQFQQAKGGSASDVIRNLPSVSVNALGEISVRGVTGFLILINGKPVQSDPAMVLKQIPANAIEDIEIITSPSAKYDPDGNAGIINIKTRQNVTDGTFLIANVMAGLPSIEPYDNAQPHRRYGADVSFNHKKGKWDVTAGLDYRRYDISGRRVGYVNTYLNEVLTEFPSAGERSFDEENYSARLSASYAINSKQSLSTGFFAGKRTTERRADIVYDNQQRSVISQEQFLGPEAYYDLFLKNNSVFPNGNVINSFTFYNENLRVRRGDFLIGSLDYSFKLDDKSSLKLSGLYERTILGGPTDNVSLSWPNTSTTYQLQYNDNDNPLDGVRLQADYSRKAGNQTWESGYQFRYLKHPGDFVYFDRDLTNQIWVENPLFTNSINLTRAIHSVYSQVSGKAKKWQYTGGLRLEYFDREVSIARPEATYDLKRFNVFPSVNLSYDLGEGFLAKGGYSRRIERTTTFKMTPFPEREHSETLEQGDAELLPEYIDAVELGVAKNWKDYSIFGNVYYRQIENVINRVNTVFNDTILNRIYTNAGTASIVGLEIGQTIYPTKKWRVFVGGNVYNFRIKGQLFEEGINTANTIYSINANTNYEFSPNFSMQLSLNYLSERVTAQGRDSRYYTPAMVVTKRFWEKRGALTLLWQNMDLGWLKTNEQAITTVRNNFFTTTNYIHEVDIIQLTFSYQLNQINKKLKLPEIEFGKSEF